eukprot:TRINITY_DN1200_c0_g1_i1.p1 TRINITY_DN1200_c0_g1~~TRINITY_DN1200_c0_g1_i1.p1  ORF type:complete len:430 (+),score=143.52 TRINITY_DN1200_c0_g1_i1:166-1455(+)
MNFHGFGRFPVADRFEPKVLHYDTKVIRLLWMCSLFGLHGLHRIYLHRKKSGVFYLCTFGFFGIGTIVDLFRLDTLKLQAEQQIEELEREQSTEQQGDFVTTHDGRVPDLHEKEDTSVKSLLVTALVSFMPLHWLLLVACAGFFSLTWAFAVGACLFAYPQLLWEKRYHFRRQIELSERMRDLSWIKYAFHYFPITLHRTVWLDPTRRYLFGYHPHGCYSFGLFTMCFARISGWSTLFPHVRCVMAVANSLLCIPLLSTVFGWLGFIPSSKYRMMGAVEQGFNIALVPGGIAEMIEGATDGDDEIVFLRARKGFVHFAIQNGMNLVPVYGFGENRTFYRYTFMKRLRQFISRKMRVTLQLFSGRWKTLIPYNVPIDVVVGTPIFVRQNYNPSEFEVNQLLERYIHELVRLFEMHKVNFPEYARKRLVVL